MGKPDLIDSNDEMLWQEHMTLIAQNTNCHIKLSVSPRADQIEKVASHTFKWSADVIRSKAELLLEQFGPYRLMWGSDWPISRLTGNYQNTHEIMSFALKNSNSDDRNRIFFATAKRFYSL
jgi:L-fuconolactonase